MTHSFADRRNIGSQPWYVNRIVPKILTRQNVANLIDQGYKPIGVFVCNQNKDNNTEEILSHNGNIIVFDRKKIVREFVDFDADEGVTGEFSFDASYVDPLIYTVDKDKTVYLLPVSALELVKLDGIEDTTLFSQNVRLSLGSTSVNKAISNSVNEKEEHKYFPLYHNGVTILCEDADLKEGKLFIKNYVVVNGAQSISTFYKDEKSLSSDLRIFVKIISLRDDALARKITINSNNQNAIKPRDLRSNHDLMVRLKNEFKTVGLQYDFEIKRGEKFDGSKEVISNEEAGRLLLAFDLAEPYSCHQIYKVFDEKYAEIFGRPEVDAYRIVFLHELMNAVDAALADLSNKQMASYKLTKYFLVDVISHILRIAEPSKMIVSRKDRLTDNNNRAAILQKLPELLGDLIVELNYEVDEAGDEFDYKKEFKSPERVKVWRDRLLKAYEKDVKKGKTVDFSKIKVG